MKVCIVGAGAIGGFIAARLALAGRAETSVLARGATLDAIRRHGLRLVSPPGAAAQSVALPASDRAEALGVQDLVVIAVKGPALAAAAASIAPLVGPATTVLPAMNGVPWWFCDRVPGFPGGPLASVDPGGRIAAAIPAAQVLGGVVHISCAVAEPGVVVHHHGRGLIVGEPWGGDGSGGPAAAPGGRVSERVRAVVELLADAGFESSASADIRRDTWYKLWGNLTMNPVSALTGATIDRLLADPLVRGLCSAAMREAALIGERIGCAIAQDPEDRHAVTARLGAFKTSMLQDAEAGRPLELDAIVGAVHEIGRRLGLATPAIDALFGLARLYGRVHGLYPDEASGAVTPAAGAPGG